MLRAATEYAYQLGMAFQIRDDLLDVIGDAAVFGKPIGSDQEEGKVTFVDLLGVEGCERQWSGAPRLPRTRWPAWMRRASSPLWRTLWLSGIGKENYMYEQGDPAGSPCFFVKFTGRDWAQTY